MSEIVTIGASGRKTDVKYGIIDTKTIHHEGDERSRTHPGHGYPAYSEEVVTFQPFASLEAVQAHVEQKSTAYGGFKGTVIRYEELPVRTKIEIEIGGGNNGQG